MQTISKKQSHVITYICTFTQFYGCQFFPTFMNKYGWKINSQPRVCSLFPVQMSQTNLLYTVSSRTARACFRNPLAQVLILTSSPTEQGSLRQITSHCQALCDISYAQNKTPDQINLSRTFLIIEITHKKQILGTGSPWTECGRRREQEESHKLKAVRAHSNTLGQSTTCTNTQPLSLQVLMQQLWLQVHRLYSEFPESFWDVLILLLPDF